MSPRQSNTPAVELCILVWKTGPSSQGYPSNPREIRPGQHRATAAYLPSVPPARTLQEDNCYILRKYRVQAMTLGSVRFEVSFLRAPRTGLQTPESKSIA